MEKLINKLNVTGSKPFGQSIALNANILAIGSDDTTVEGCENCGTVHLFKRSDEKWVQTQTLYHPDPMSDSFFGWSVAVDPLGRRIVVGADDHDGVAPCAGAVYIYDKQDEGKYGLVQILYPEDVCKRFAYFGFSVDVYGDELIVGAPSYQSSAENLLQGHATPAVYFYMKTRGQYELVDTATTAWPFFGGNVRVTKHGYLSTSHKNKNGEIWVYDKRRVPFQVIYAPDNAKGFGKSIDVFDDWLIVGAPLSDYGGAAYLYAFISGKYRLITELFHIGVPGSCFGYDVSINKWYFAVSDPRCGDHLKFENYCGGSDAKGILYLFDLDLDFNLLSKKETENPAGGHVIHLGDKQIFEGNPATNNNQGEVNIYDYSEF